MRGRVSGDESDGQMGSRGRAKGKLGLYGVRRGFVGDSYTYTV